MRKMTERPSNSELRKYNSKATFYICHENKYFRELSDIMKLIIGLNISLKIIQVIEIKRDP